MSATEDRAAKLGEAKVGAPMGAVYVQGTDANGNPVTITFDQYYNALFISPGDNAYLVPEGTIANSFLATP